MTALSTLLPARTRPRGPRPALADRNIASDGAPTAAVLVELSPPETGLGVIAMNIGC